MKNKTWTIIGCIAAFVLAATLIVGVLPSDGIGGIWGTATDATGDNTGDSSDGYIDPFGSTLSFPTSDSITETFMSAAKNAAWTNTDGTWTYVEGSGARVALPPTFVLPTDEKLLFRFDTGISPRLRGFFWNNMKGSVDFASFDDTVTRQTMFNFKNPDSDVCTVEDLRNNLRIYTRSDIQANLQQKNLSNEHLNQLIDLLVCGGCFFESSVDALMTWDPDYDLNNPVDGFYGNRICMRYPVSVPQDLRIKVADGYECIVYLFESLDSLVCAYTYGWGDDSLYMTVPANTPFCVAVRPAGLTDILSEERDNYPYVHVEDWQDIVTFESVK